MKVSISTVLTGMMLMTGSALAQTQQQPPQTPPPAAPAAQAPAPPPVPPRPFPEGAKMAYVNFQRIAAESAEGRNATAKVKALNDKKVADLNYKNTQLQAAQDKLQKGGTVLSDLARGQLEKEVERIQVDIQRFTQDAQTEVQDLQQELQNEFQRKVLPVVGQVAAEKGLQIVFSQFDSGIVWADTGLDITTDVIKRFDAPTGTAPAAKPPAKPPID